MLMIRTSHPPSLGALVPLSPSQGGRVQAVKKRVPVSTAVGTEGPGRPCWDGLWGVVLGWPYGGHARDAAGPCVLRVGAREGTAPRNPPPPCVPVIGALIGRQEGRNIEVMNSFELLSHTVEENIVIDKEYYYTKEEQFKQVFKDMEFLGWYTTGGPPDQSDIHVHKQ
ncbi:COP9 signalosome complex subunit 6a, partial [Terrapene carolina triunguis]|uniref:COP9 signalosome complex subunit 6a n=1 Tax=Terrapene triunguis TaxID=2587831 RepID=UPI000CEF7034